MFRPPLSELCIDSKLRVSRPSLIQKAILLRPPLDRAPHRQYYQLSGPLGPFDGTVSGSECSQASSHLDVFVLRPPL